MKSTLSIIVSLLISIFFGTSAFSQENASETLDLIETSELKPNRLSLYFGWNRSAYSKSDLHLKGDDYDFTILNVEASDRQTEFSLEKYFAIKNLTIPQTNMGFSFQYSDKVSISLNVDHMKYIMDQNQVAKLNGSIGKDYPDFQGEYDNSPTEITSNLLRFEHSDGLNYINLGYSRNEVIGAKKRILTPQLDYGGSIGFLLPKTNSQLLDKKRHDDFHLAGYGIGVHTGLQLNIGRVFFISALAKGGFINMPDIRTSPDKSDSAKQHFYYVQLNGTFGIKLNLERIKKAS